MRIDKVFVGFRPEAPNGDCGRNRPGLADSFRHYSIVQDGGKNADAVLPIVHVLFSNVKTWLNGTYHGVSAKHLPRYARGGTTASIAAAASPI